MTKTSDLKLRAEAVLNKDILAFLVDLHTQLEPERQRLLAARRQRQADFDRGQHPQYVQGHPGTGTVWQVTTIPADVQERRVEITGPVNSAKMVINMLSANARGVRADMAMLDFEDSMMPSWENVISGFENVLGVARGDLSCAQPAEGGKAEKVYKLDAANMAHPMVRVRGLHLNEANVLVGGQAIAGGLLDLAVCAFHTAKLFLNKGRTPMFYVPKCEHFEEARWWNQLFQKIERHLGLAQGALRATFLIETLPAAYQMEEILYEIRERACGLNGGRWDKIFSDIKVLKSHRDRISANRSSIDMSCSWMDNYAKRLIKICHRHGAFAMGGMSAFTPGQDEQTRIKQVAKVRADKAREAMIGHDGCWVSHPFFIDIARAEFSKKNQLDVLLRDFPDQPDLLIRSEGPRNLQGLRTNIRVGIAYMEGWRRGIGCVAFDNLMEDLATLEISRAQVWQWLHHQVQLDDGVIVSRALVEKIFAEEVERIISEMRQDLAKSGRAPMVEAEQAYLAAAHEAQNLFLQDELAEFLCQSSPIAQPIEITKCL